MSEGDAQDAMTGASEQFAELLRVLEAAMADASQVGDQELLERLARAKAAAEHSNGLVSRLSDILQSGSTASDA